MTALRLVGISLLLLAPLLRQLVAAQVLDPTFTPPTGLYAPGTVYALGPQQADGKRVVAGTFTRASGTAVSGSLLRLTGTGSLDTDFAQRVGAAANVYHIRRQANGQYLLGAEGGNVTAGSLVRAEVLRLNADGTADATFDPGTGPAMTNDYGYGMDYTPQADGKVLVGGYFDSFNGVAANGLVRLNANGSVDTGFSTGSGVGSGGTSYSNVSFASNVAVQADGKILVAGAFATFNGQPAGGLVRLTATGSRDAAFSSPFLDGSSVNGLVVQPDGRLLVSGYLQTGPSTTLGLARLLANGSLDPSFTTAVFSSGTIGFGSDSPIVLQADGKIVVTGYFSFVGANYIARLNPNGSLDPSFYLSPGPDSPPYALGVQADGTILAGGYFLSFNGLEAGLVRLTPAGALDASYAPKLQVAGSVAAVLRQADGQLVLGGNFTELNGVAVHRLARVSAAGVPDASFAAATGPLPGVVSCLALQADGKVLAGTTGGLVRLAPSGLPDASFAPFVNAATTSLAVQADGRIFMGGGFSGSVGGVAYNSLVRLTASGAYDPTFVRPVTASIGTPISTDALLLQPDGRLVVGGQFRLANASYLTRVVRYESTGALDASFNNTSNFGTTSLTSPNSHRLSTLARQADGKLLAGGLFGSVDGITQAAVARLTPTGQLDASFNPGFYLSNTINSVAVQPNGRVLLGGTFALNGGLSNLTRVLASGQPDASFTPTANPTNTVRTLLVQPDGGLVVGGSFTTVGGLPALGLARLTAPNVLAVAAPAAVAARTQAWPVPAHSVLHVAPDAGAQPRTLELLDGLGRAVRTLPLPAAAPEVALSVEGLPAGLYLLRVSYATGTVTRAIAVE